MNTSKLHNLYIEMRTNKIYLLLYKLIDTDFPKVIYDWYLWKLGDMILALLLFCKANFFFSISWDIIFRSHANLQLAKDKINWSMVPFSLKLPSRLTSESLLLKLLQYIINTQLQHLFVMLYHRVQAVLCQIYMIWTILRHQY